MPFPILGLHHVTATVDQAQPDLDFCVETLGLRLVKKTVNFDNHHVFHFYYGDERGTPGTIWTTFPYHGRNVRVGTKGAGQVTVTSFSVPEGSLDFWARRLSNAHIDVEDAPRRFGEDAIVVTDPSGLAIELIAANDSRPGWTRGGVGEHEAVRGIHSVSLSVHAPAATVALLADLFGFEQAGEIEGRIRMAAPGGGPGKTVDVIHDPAAPTAVNGLGTVHHVAFAIGTAEEQLRLRNELIRRGVKVTDVLDRQYFKSIYFREPGGVLFEVATVQPGFAVDEPLDCLGQDLKLPPWEEPNRGLIESGLPPIVVRR
jgi:glyoxalase family protein